jgi:8-oxo-dGTP pyrophosphatase MutT (NUDIX family)
MSQDAVLQGLIEALTDYAVRQPSRATTALQFVEFARAGPSCLERSRTTGHFTASAFVVSVDGLRTLLTHHARLGRWLQPGGHLEGGEAPATAALREATEESGLTNLVIETPIFDLDRHWIPARLAEPGHWHYDVRFVVRAMGDDSFTVSSESLALAWRNIEELAVAFDVDDSLVRMARQWLELWRSRCDAARGITIG